MFALGKQEEFRLSEQTLETYTVQIHDKKLQTKKVSMPTKEAIDGYVDGLKLIRGCDVTLKE